MLILNRKEGESIQIGECIKITVLKVSGNVRIGIAAPKKMNVLRDEVHRKPKD